MPKIVLIGVGSGIFGCGTLVDLLYYRDILNGSTISLVDIDPERLALMHQFAEKLNKEAGSPYIIEASLDRRDVLSEADFVITSPAIKREDLWEIDWGIVRKSGIRQTYGECGGPGALSHTLRNVPLILEICSDIAELAPMATVINFTNPESRICMAISRYTSLKFVGLCHGILEAYHNVSRVTGIPEEELDIKAAGLNHFTWIYEISNKQTGKSEYDLFRRCLDQMPENFQPLSRRLFSTFGMWPTTGDRHLAEYFSYGWEFVGLEGRDFRWWRNFKSEVFDWIRGVIDGTRLLEERIRGRTSESVADVIVAITTAQNHYEIALDILNNGCIPNLPQDAIVEVPGIVSGDGIRGLCMSPLPEGIAAMARQQIAIQKLSIESAMTGDRQKAFQALLIDPVIDNYQAAELILDELLMAQRENIMPLFFSREY